MKEFFKRFFKRSEKVIVVKAGKTYKFNAFSKAVAFMIA